MLWWVGASFLFIWFVLKVLFHRAGFVHMFLLAAISIFVVQIAAYRKARYQKTSSE